MAGVSDFELIAYSSRGENVLSNGVSFILVRYSIKELQVETRGRTNIASFEIQAILGNFQCFRSRPCHMK